MANLPCSTQMTLSGIVLGPPLAYLVISVSSAPGETLITVWETEEEYAGPMRGKRNSTGQSPAARKGFGGAGDGGAAVGARKQDPKRMGAVRRLGEVPGAILEQANGRCRVPALVLPLPRGRGNQIWRRVGGAAGNGRAQQPGGSLDGGLRNRSGSACPLPLYLPPPPLPPPPHLAS